MRAARLIGAALLALLLAGCDTVSSLNPFGGGEEEERLQGPRISALQLATEIEPDPEVSDLAVTLPDPVVNPDWPQAGMIPSHNPGNLSVDAPLAPVWSTDIGEGSGGGRRLLNPPIVVDGRVYATDAGGHLTALSASSGERLWQVRIASPYEDTDPIGGGVAFADDLLYVTTGFGELLAIDPTNGGEVWREEANAPIRAPPTSADGRVYVLTVDNQLEAYAAADGQPLWNHTGILEPASLLGAAAPAVTQGAVIAPYSSGEVFALRPESGRPLWSDSLTAIGRAGALASLADIRGMPVIDGDRVFVVSHSGRMVALDLRSGARAWEQEFGGINMPWVAGNFIFVLTNNSEVVAITRDTGRIRWVYGLERWEDPEDREDRIVWAGPVMGNGQLVLVNSVGQGVILSSQEATVLSEFELEDPSQIMPVIADNTLFILSEDGTLTAYR
jgi:outer membrane protein assembly factor BamB